MKEYPTELVQPLGDHNPKAECVPTKYVEDYIKLSYPHLNPLQSEFLKYLEDDDLNLIVAAPTSSGKTLCAELFAARALKVGKKIIYMAPMKALADEKYEEWTNPTHSLSVYNPCVLTGDFQFTEAKKKELASAKIIVMTPEMFNSKCRLYNSNKWMHDAWIIGDEIHLIGMENRGDALEVGLIQYYENDIKTRSLFLSATIPNVTDLSEWLEHLSGRESKVIFSDYRPCKLNLSFRQVDDLVYGKKIFYKELENKRLEAATFLALSYKDHPTLIFVGSKDFGQKLTNSLKLLGLDVRFHNADLERESRKKIESDFKNLKFKTLVATPTLAWGCIPEDCVISTENGYKEIKDLDPNEKIYYRKNGEDVLTNNWTIINEDQRNSFIEIMLDNGSFIQATEEHFVSVGDSFKKVSDLKLGDELVIKSFENKTLETDNNSNFYYLIGVMAGDGYYLDHKTNSPIAFCKNKKMRESIIDLSKKEGIFYSCEKRDCETHIISFSKKKKFINKIKNNLKCIDDYKKIDYNLLYLEESKLLSILAGLLDTNGFIEKNKIILYNTSKWIISFFSMALKRFGIDCTCERREKNSPLLKGKLVIVGKDCFELNIISRKGIFFIHDKISKFMKDEDKISLIENVIITSNIESANELPKTSATIIDIEEKECSKNVYDISIINEDNEFNKNYYVNDVLVHNCNTPARYVICTHTSYGKTPMHPANIMQKIGRAGRAGYSTEGDAIILLPSSEYKQEKERITKKYKIQSTLSNIDVLMFHIIQYIHDGEIKNVDDFIDWYGKTLYSVQNSKKLNKDVANLVFKALSCRNMIKKDNEGNYIATKLGEITTQMYMSPMDVSDRFLNFSKLKAINPDPGAPPHIVDHINANVSAAICKCASYGITSHDGINYVPTNLSYVSKRERDSETYKKLCRFLDYDPEDYSGITSFVKYAAVVYSMLSNREIDYEIRSAYSVISKDIDRIITTLKRCDDSYGRYLKDIKGYGWGSEWDRLKNRIKYGTDSSWGEVKGVGKVKIQKLEEAGITSPQDLKDRTLHEKAKKILGNKLLEKVLEEYF